MKPIIWEDENGTPLPEDDRERQYLRLHYGRCRPSNVRVRAIGADRVILTTNPLEELEQVEPGVFKRPLIKPNKAETSAVGKLTAEAWAGGLSLGSRELTVLPANFSEEEYEGILLDIGLMALNSGSTVAAPMFGNVVDKQSGAANKIGFEAIHQVHIDVLDCVEAIVRAFPGIERQPLRQISRKMAVVPLRRLAQTRAGIHAFAKTPGRQHVLVGTLVDDVDCAENQYLRWLVEKKLPPLLRLLGRSAQVHSESDRVRLESISRGQRKVRKQSTLARELNDKAQKRKEENTRQTEQYLQRFQRAEKALATIRGSGFWKRIRLPTTEPPITERLLGAAHYREISAVMLRGSWAARATAQRGVALAESIVNGQTKATWYCYEIWCFAQMVRMLTVIGGFKYAPGSKSFEELIEIRHGEMELLKDGSLQFERNKTAVTLKVQCNMPSTVDPMGLPVLQGLPRYLRPDMVLEVRQPGQKRLVVVLDAKYRGYRRGDDDGEHKHRFPTTLFEDLWVTGYRKYFKGLSEADKTLPKAKWASFILHSDSDRQLEYWGGTPPQTWFEELGLKHHKDPEFETHVDHRLGLIPIRPDERRDIQLGRFLDLLFGYLIPPNQLACTRCGTEVDYAKDIASLKENPFKDEMHKICYLKKKFQEGWVGAEMCVCPNCANQWYLNHCEDESCRQRIYKVGNRSFHAPSKKHPRQTGMYLCPKCGNDPDLMWWG